MNSRHHIYRILAAVAAIFCSTGGWPRGSVTVRTMLNDAGSRYTETVTYYDGLGRPVQTLSKGINTGNVPVLTVKELNPDGTVSRQWLPFGVSGITGRIPDTSVATLSRTSLSDSHAYSDVTYDALGRITNTSTSGDAWHNSSKGISISHSSNAKYSVKKYIADASGTGISFTGYWSPCTLKTEKTTDEDGHVVEVFTDIGGRTVLERRGGNHDTYYVYNRVGQLRFVLQPMYEEISDTEKYAFEYRYDIYGNMVYKAVPGGGYTQFWYDRSCRMTFMQDANLRSKGGYRFFLYDKVGRLVIQGVAGSCTPSQTVNTAFYEGGSNGFMSTGYVLADQSQIQQVTLETVNYYDSYTFVGSLSTDLAKSGTADATGRVTGSVVYASDGSKSMSAVYYDIKGNITETRELTNFGTKRVTSGTYTFTGQPLKTTVTEGSVTVVTENTYDTGSGLLTATDVTVNGVEQRVSAVTYDDLGRISKVTRGTSANSGGTVEYGYNLHGQTTRINGPGFSQNIYYADWPGTKCYNGSVSAMTWTMGPGSARRGYRYSYNGYGWLTSADYGESEALTANKDRYTEKSTGFTRNGSVTRLQRNGLRADGTYGKVDDLTLAYDGNRVTGVSDAAPAVTQNGSMDYPGGFSSKVLRYNSFGALVSDGGRGITSISYDDFGNPVNVQYEGNRSTSNVYSATGEKLKTVHTFSIAIQAGMSLLADVGDISLLADDMNIVGAKNKSTVEYHGNVIYRDGKVDMVLFPDGYAAVSGASVTFHYYTKDYLGNNRAVINGSTGAIEQTVAYYPYGGVIADLGTNSTTGQPYKFGSKELITANGLNEYDFGARMYYSAVPGFTKPDPLCEDTQWLSPYLYCGNNPVNAIDPDGRSTWVMDIGGGLYQVVGGDLNDRDLSVYVYNKDEDGNYSRGKTLGQTTSYTSFFDSDYNEGEGKWMTNSVIDTNDGSGMQFMYNLISEDPSLMDYMTKARNGHEYDFKATNGNPEENTTLDHYRGMPFGFTDSGTPIYTSARDIGNIGAGYVSARNKLPWSVARLGFDSYQSYQSGTVKKEGISTRNAERYGYEKYKKGFPLFNIPSPRVF